ncbi:hypothetical protein MKW98_017722 [Papaver atlanticum]|uniref:Uncharacterized protein n=1 Tax=Papaver atlanticum TaxID=357466 RepID=A0AAD4TEM5_9MAGN|nr:hypothetical protein MKW98_017722 [Papaver atlanticum]
MILKIFIQPIERQEDFGVRFLQISVQIRDFGVRDWVHTQIVLKRLRRRSKRWPRRSVIYVGLRSLTWV